MREAQCSHAAARGFACLLDCLCANAATPRPASPRTCVSVNQMHRAMQQQRKRLSARLIDGLSKPELAQLKRLLARMRANLGGA